MYLLDTDIISTIIKKAPSPSLLKKLASVDVDKVMTSVITVGELVYGAYKSDRPEYFIEKLMTTVWPNVQILPFDRQSAEVFGETKAMLSKLGITVHEPDLRIAAIALARKFIVVTGNEKHFSKVPNLCIENWLK